MNILTRYLFLRKSSFNPHFVVILDIKAWDLFVTGGGFFEIWIEGVVFSKGSCTKMGINILT
jgi:hypothetical protein